MRGGKPVSHWRDNALEAAAQIAEAYHSHPGVAADIRALKSPDGVDASECLHDETERLGAIWTRCNQCGRQWADDDPKNPLRKAGVAPSDHQPKRETPTDEGRSA